MTWEKFGWTAVVTLAILAGNSSVLAAPITPMTSVAKTISLEDLKGAPAKLNFMLDRITVVDFEKRVKSIDSGNSRLFEVLIEDSRKCAFLKPQPQAGTFADLGVSFVVKTLSILAQSDFGSTSITRARSLQRLWSKIRKNSTAAHSRDCNGTHRRVRCSLGGFAHHDNGLRNENAQRFGHVELDLEPLFDCRAAIPQKSASRCI